MNDRYLYRAKRTDNREWVEGNLVWSDDADDDYKAIIIPTTGSNMFTKGGASGDLGFEKWYRVDPSTICQCTGLKGENGKMIWENDIVFDPEERKFYKIIFSEEDMCYYAQDADGYKHTFESCYGSSIEVEGDIFNNPELFE